MKTLCQKISVLAVSLMLLSACGDKTPEEARKEKFDQEVSRLSKAAGNYKGSININGETLPMAVNLKLNVAPTNGSDVGNNSQVSLKGSVTIFGEAPTEAAITSANFNSVKDSESGTFGGVVTVTSTSGTVLGTLSMSGTINGNQFNGSISPDNRPGSTGNFSVVKDADFPGGQPSTDPNPRNVNEKYAGTYEMKCDSSDPLPCPGGRRERPVKMVVRKFDPSSADAFFYRFVPQKTAIVTLLVSRSNVTFPTANYDRGAGTIAAETTVGSGTNTSTLTLNCRRQRLNQQVTGWNCHFTSSYTNVEYDFLLAPDANFQE